MQQPDSEVCRVLAKNEATIKQLGDLLAQFENDVKVFLATVLRRA